MANKLTIDTGIMEYEVNGGELLRFNPSDPNLYHRFAELASELPELVERFHGREKELPEAGGQGMLDLMNEFDGILKSKLAHVFGDQNDFDRILGGVNLLAVGKNGKHVVSNVLDALYPIMDKGVKQHRQHAAAEAVAEATSRRAGRGK